LTNCTLTIEQVPANDSQVKLTVKYTLTPNQTEKLAGSVFGGVAELRRDDPGTAGDTIITTINDAQFAVNTATNSITRTVTRTVLKSLLNEDVGFNTEGAEQEDEVFARAVVTYLANAPIPLPDITPANSTVHSGAWTA